MTSIAKIAKLLWKSMVGKPIDGFECPDVAVIALALCGCVNCATVRNPWSDDEVRMCYQSTAASVAVAGFGIH